MLILAAKLRIYTKYLDSSFSGKRCLSIRNHKPQTSYSGKRHNEMFRDEAYEMGSEQYYPQQKYEFSTLTLRIPKVFTWYLQL